MSELKEKLTKIIEAVDKSNASDNVNNIQNNPAQNENKIVVLKPNEINSIEEIVPEFAISLNTAKERINMLQNFVKEMMVANIDYGVIKGCNKPSLLKPGAEKLCDIFGFSKQLEVLNRVEDWSTGFFHYEIKVILVNKKTGLIEAEGIGCCNSKEKKYLNQDSYNIINTLLKMAKKRALIDAVLSATRSSGIFTQDIEDMELGPYKNGKNREPLCSPTTKNNNLINKDQQLEIIKLVQQNQISLSEFKALLKEKFNVEQTKLLTSEQADEVIDILKLFI